MDNINQLSKTIDYNSNYITRAGYDSPIYGRANDIESTRRNSKYGTSDIRNTKYELVDRGRVRKKWQRANGDVGERPEEKYKPNRYLQAQEIKRTFR